MALWGRRKSSVDKPHPPPTTTNAADQRATYRLECQPETFQKCKGVLFIVVNVEEPAGLFNAIKPNITKPNNLSLIYMYKKDSALNNLQWLICHKTQANQILYIHMYKQDLKLNNLQWLICHKTQPTSLKVDEEAFLVLN